MKKLDSPAWCCKRIQDHRSTNVICGSSQSACSIIQGSRALEVE